jgi:hypothetical protein
VSCALVTLCLVLIPAMMPRAAVAQAGSAGEYEVKAAMLYNLTRFVEWPPSVYADPHAATVLCILGRDPFESSLASLVSKSAVSNRPVEIRHLQDNNDIRACHVLYVSSSARKDVVQILSQLKGSSVLTVGEMNRFAERGGMIQFSLEEKEVRFDINLDAAARANLKISSRLLALARIVKEQGVLSGEQRSASSPRRLELTRSSLALSALLQRNSSALSDRLSDSGIGGY